MQREDPSRRSQQGRRIATGAGQEPAVPLPVLERFEVTPAPEKAPVVLWLEVRDPIFTTRTGLPQKVIRASDGLRIVPVVSDEQRAFPGDPTAFILVVVGEKFPMRIAAGNVGTFQFGSEA